MPFSRRQVFDAATISLNTISLAVVGDNEPFVRRNFDRKRAVAINRRGAAEMLVALEHEHPTPGAGVERRRGQTAKPGSDRDCIEMAGHAQTLASTISL